MSDLFNRIVNHMIQVLENVKREEDHIKMMSEGSYCDKKINSHINFIYVTSMLVSLAVVIYIIILVNINLLLLFNIGRFLYFGKINEIYSIIYKAFDISIFILTIVILLVTVSSWIIYIVIKNNNKEKNDEIEFRFIFLTSIMNAICENAYLDLIKIFIIFFTLFILVSIVGSIYPICYGIYILLTGLYLTYIIYKTLNRKMIMLNKLVIYLLVTPILAINLMLKNDIPSSIEIIASTISIIILFERIINLLLQYYDYILNGDDIFFLNYCYIDKYIDRIYKNMNITSIEEAKNLDKLYPSAIINFYKKIMTFHVNA